MVGAPSYTFASDDDTGFYRIGADNIGMTLNGLEYDFSTTTFDAKSNDITTSGKIIATGGGQTGMFQTGSSGNTVFAYSGGNWDIRAGNGNNASQNVMRVDSSGDFNFYDGNITTTGTIFAGEVNITGDLTTSGTTWLGDANTDIHGINTTPVASKMLTADFTSGGSGPFFIDGTLASTFNDTKTVFIQKPVVINHRSPHIYLCV